MTTVAVTMTVRGAGAWRLCGRDGKRALRQEASPFDVYESPSSSFVSGFLGKSNNLRAELKSSSAEGSEIVCNGVSLSAGSTELPPGPVEIALRPERINIDAAGSGLPGQVTERVFLGSQWLLKVDTDLGELLVSRGNVGRQEAAVGDRVFLRWDSAHLRILPLEAEVART